MTELIFRYPHQTQLYRLFPQEDGDFTFKLHSFDSQSERIVKGSRQEISKEEIAKLHWKNTQLKGRFSEATDDHDSYRKKIETIRDFVSSNGYPKLVLARKKWVPSGEAGIDLTESFLKLCDSYSNTFVYLYIDEQEAWLGCTPEILARYNQTTEAFITMSLAGTLPKDETWSEKEIKEQAPVTDYIAALLKPLTSDLKISETFDHISGNIKHLRNDITAKLKPDLLDRVIEEMHPTPAVCGIPTDKCQRELLSVEGFNRSFYTGYVMVKNSENTDAFVNLRCAQILQNGAVLYVGGGITAQSDPEKEWRETELKSQAVGNRLVFLS